MADRQKLDFLILRYVPDAVKGEFVNIGVLLLGDGFADVRLTTDWRRVRCLDPDVDLEMLETFAREIRSQLQNSVDRESALKRLTDSFSGVIQVSGPAACLGAEPAEEIETLVRMYLEKPLRPGKREVSSRQRILSEMQRSFEAANVWKHMHKEIAVSRYTDSGDPLKIDCGYRPNGIIKMFHAVPLVTNPDLAKILAFSYGQMSSGIQIKEQASSSLTAIVEDNLDRSNAAIGFALTTLERAQIGVAEVGSMPAIAEQARLELHL
ncbi:MAG: DUF3037 domain-containing protein [Acidobacteria bacterium]|nr:MAG: DUF3037 domain-containing protein [Acidobacteriota bacterium]